jgi:hypothetical protein
MPTSNFLKLKDFTFTDRYIKETYLQALFPPDCPPQITGFIYSGCRAISSGLKTAVNPKPLVSASAPFFGAAYRKIKQRQVLSFPACGPENGLRYGTVTEVSQRRATTRVRPCKNHY